MARGQAEARWVLSPGLAEAPVLDRLCSHFVLTLTLRQAGRFNLRRDCNSLLALTGRHLGMAAGGAGAAARLPSAALQGQRGLARA